MKVLVIKFASWDEEYYFLPEDENGNPIDARISEKFVVETAIGVDIGEVYQIKEISESESSSLEIKPISRVATNEDLDILKKNNLNNKKIIRETKLLIKKHELEMKLSDIHISYDDKMMVFSFIADGRIDFRELVKDLSKKYKKKIRLYQLGVRDEAKMCGDIGDCGQILCCKRFLKRLESINTGFARDQQIAHRGLDKLSGMCGRLKCCLAYEESHYQEILSKLPQIGDKVSTKDGMGLVIELMPLKNSARVRLEKDGVIITVKY